MSKEDKLILDYLALLKHLSTDLKLRLIARLSESLRDDYERAAGTPDNSWKELFGAWSDTREDLADFIRDNRLPNREIPDFGK